VKPDPEDIQAIAEAAMPKLLSEISRKIDDYGFVPLVGAEDMALQLCTNPRRLRYAASQRQIWHIKEGTQYRFCPIRTKADWEKLHAGVNQ